MFQKFWEWYERTLPAQVTIVAILFVWQLTHLYWLTTDVVFLRLFGISLFPDSRLLKFAVIVADYAEIPALLSATLYYSNELRKKFSRRSLTYLLLVNSQWLHLFWITDTFVVHVFSNHPIGLPAWLAWIAIGIDYLELPVIYDTLKKSLAIYAPKWPKKPL
jgi:hypothetical protein